MRTLRRLAVSALVAFVCACARRPPLSFDFERDTDLDKLGWNCLSLLSLSEKHATSGTRSLEIQFFPNPGQLGALPALIYFSRFDPDWSARGFLVLDVYNPHAEGISLGMSIDDRRDPPVEDCYNTQRIVHPGPNHVVIPLSALWTTGTKRKLRLDRITGLTIFIPRPAEKRTLYLDRLRLE